ncbi:hypothetical protein ACLQ28_14440 [Micromonospora sp. DT201]|uniref:hypothetical protein n=1 Tax=Micromonospora sp. DT201 TaxID=3393442 RepID=UPI003CF1494D
MRSTAARFVFAGIFGTMLALAGATAAQAGDTEATNVGTTVVAPEGTPEEAQTLDSWPWG